MNRSTLRRLALCGCALLPCVAFSDPQLDQLLEQAAPILAESEVYHTPEDGGETPPVLPLTLESCVSIALENNAQILEADTDVAIREAQAGQARARRLPQVKGQVSYNYIEELDQGIGRPGIQRLIGADGYAPEKDTLTSSLTITQLVYAGGQIQAAVKASTYLAASEAWRRDAIRAEIAYEAREAFHNALLASALGTVADEALEAFERHLKDTEALLREGAVTGFEVMRAKTEVGARQSDREAARAAIKLADIQMRRILALPDNQPLSYDAAIPWAPLGAPVAQVIDRARAQRPELRALEDALSAAAQQERGVKGKYMPQAAATLKWQNVDHGGRVLTDGWQVNVGAQWDLYLGGQRKHERGEVRARAESLRIQRAEMERLVAADVEQAYIRLTEAAAAMRTGQETVRLAEESVRLAKLRFQEGAGTQTEIIDTALTRTRSKTALVQAIRDYFVAYASLLRAAGGDPLVATMAVDLPAAPESGAAEMAATPSVEAK